MVRVWAMETRTGLAAEAQTIGAWKSPDLISMASGCMLPSCRVSADFAAIRPSKKELRLTSEVIDS